MYYEFAIVIFFCAIYGGIVMGLVWGVALHTLDL